MTSYNENTPLPLLAKELRKRVSKLLLIYYLLIIGTVLFSVSIIFLSAGFIGYLIMKGYDMAALRIGIIPLILSIIIGIAGIDAILTPLVSLMRPKAHKGQEIFKNYNPELFSLIEDVVKQSGCKMPKHVYVTNNCNASCSYANIWGYIFSGQQNLSIGLPLLLPLNKSELKSVLAHEFGHFSQKSVGINKIANLSEFICATIGDTYEAYEMSNYDFDKNVKFFARITYRIMLSQYRKVAPLNGILSRAQELDADKNALTIAGVDATISALSKTDYISIRWKNFVRIIGGFLKDRRIVSEIMPLWECYKSRLEEIGEQELNIDTHINNPRTDYNSRVTHIDDISTHPSIEQRCSIIKEYYRIPTLWDDTSALSLFNLDYALYIKDTLIDDLKIELFNNKDEVLNGDTVCIDEFKSIVEEIIPSLLECFYCHDIFFCDDTANFDKTISKPVFFPFTDHNAQILREYYVASGDMMLLRDIMNNNSSELRYLYDGEEYNGQNVPIDKHSAYLDRLRHESINIALNCNIWLCKHSDKYEILQFINYYYDAFKSGQTSMESVYSILKNGDNTTKAKEYVKSVKSEFKRICSDLINASNGEVVKYIFDTMRIEDEDRNRFFEFCMNGTDDEIQICLHYRFIYGVTSEFFNELRTYLLKNTVLPRMLEKHTPNV